MTESFLSVMPFGSRNTELENAEIESENILDDLGNLHEFVKDYGKEISLGELITKLDTRLHEIWRDFPELEPDTESF